MRLGNILLSMTHTLTAVKNKVWSTDEIILAAGNVHNHLKINSTMFTVF